MSTLAPFRKLFGRRIVVRIPRASCRGLKPVQNQGFSTRVPFLDDNTRNLVNRALEQDRDAIDLLFQRYRDRLRTALRKLIGPKYRVLMADSEDATHDAILSALRRLHQFEYRGEGSFLAWLLKGAEYEIIRRIRALETKKRSAVGGNVAHDDGPAAPGPRERKAHVSFCVYVCRKTAFTAYVWIRFKHPNAIRTAF